jgi:hypothetical protein
MLCHIIGQVAPVIQRVVVLSPSLSKSPRRRKEEEEK